MTNEEFVVHLKRKKVIIFFLVIVFFIASLYVQYKWFNDFKATNTFTIYNSESIETGTSAPDMERFYFERSGVNKIYSVIYSTEMLDYLIKKFNLYKHFHVNINDPYHYENMIGTLLNKISAIKTDHSVMTLTVKDRNPELAADIANDIVNQINVICRDQYLSKINQKIAFYENMLRDVQSQDSMQRTQMYTVIKEVKEIGRLFNRNSEQAEKLDNQLLSLTQHLQNNSENFSKAFQLYRAAYGSLEGYDLQSVATLRKALPDRRDLILKKLSISSAFTLLFFCSIAVLYYYYLVNKPLLSLIFLKAEKISIKQSSS